MKPLQNHPPFWAYPLWPLGLCLLGAARVKAWWYGHVASPLDLRRPTVSIGNLTFGGTGKTPVTIAVARLLQGMGQRPAVLLRGYGRTTHGARVVDSRDSHHDVGDEALLLALPPGCAGGRWRTARGGRGARAPRLHSVSVG